MALLTRDDLRRQSWFAWGCLAGLLGVAAWFRAIGKGEAALGTLAASAGCAALLLPPRERMRVLPARLRALPRGLDAAPVLAALLSSPGYGLNWFYGANPYDEAVHLLSGALLGAVTAGLLLADGRRRGAAGTVLVGTGTGFGLAVLWEVFEWTTALIGDWNDTWTDVALTTGGAALGALGWTRLAARSRAEGRPRDGAPDAPPALRRASGA